MWNVRNALLENSTENLFIEKSWRASKPLELVHFNFYVQFEVTSLSSIRYFFTIIDDYIKKLWVYPLK